MHRLPVHVHAAGLLERPYRECGQQRHCQDQHPTRTAWHVELLFAGGPLQRRQGRTCQTASNPRSSAAAPCVSAPTEIISTPVSAIDATVSRFTPPEASTTQRPAMSCTP